MTLLYIDGPLTRNEFIDVLSINVSKIVINPSLLTLKLPTYY